MAALAVSRETIAEAPAALAFDEVHLYTLDVAAARPWLASSATLLSSSELARAEATRPGLARDEFLLGRACLRALLASQLDCDPHWLPITTGADGKPQLEYPLSHLAFNVSHSRGNILIALSTTATLGIDIEAIDNSIEAIDIARENFASSELRAIAETPNGESRARVFSRIWSRKEAILKLHGSGLLVPLNSFAVSLESSVEQRISWRDPDSHTQHAFVRELPAAPGFAAALAASRPNLTLTTRPLAPALLHYLLPSANHR